MILTNCNCPIKIECECGTLSFDYYNAAAVSVLEVGELVSSESGCILDGYVIDWYVDDVLTLTTGVGDDPDIQAIHPFIGDAAIPVIGGSYVPVIRYLVIDGDRVFTSPKPCQKWCDVDLDLPVSIEVARLNCGSSNITGSYQYQIKYISTDPDSLPSRIVAVDLPDDLSTLYFAINFYGYDISDKVELYFNGVTLLTAWIIGSDSSNQFDSLPFGRKNTSYHRFVVELPEYDIGDFLTIVITPAVIAGIPQTNWLMQYKCLDNSKSFDCGFLEYTDIREYDIDNWTFTLDEINCRREFRINMINAIPNWRDAASSTYWFSLYGGMNNTSFQSNVGYSYSNAIGGADLRHTKTVVNQTYYISGYSTRYETYGSINLEKDSSGDYVWTFADSRDWQDAKDNYDYSKTTSWWTNRETSDTSDPKYYRWWYWYWRSRPANCGDTEFSLKYLYFHHLSTITFDSGGGVYTLTIEPYQVTNEYSDELCNSLVSTINNLITLADATINADGFDEDTLCNEHMMFGYGIGYTGVTPNIVTGNFAGYASLSYGETAPCLPLNDMCTTYAGGAIAWYYFAWAFRVEITLEKDPVTGDFPRDSGGEYEDDPLDNFEAYWALDANYCLLTSIVGCTKILTVEEGIVTFSLSYEDLVTLLYS